MGTPRPTESTCFVAGAIVKQLIDRSKHNSDNIVIFRRYEISNQPLAIDCFPHQNKIQSFDKWRLMPLGVI